MRLIVLSDDFYQRHEHHREILQKRTRPYVCLEVTINGTTFAIPFRHHIKHRYAFITYGESGIDYTKAVVIASDDDVANRTPQIEQREYNALVGRDALIHNGMVNYIALYKKAKTYEHNPFYANIRKYSSLQYFEKYL